MIKCLLVLLLFASINCGLADVIRKSMCLMKLLPLQLVLKAGKLDFQLIKLALNDKQCGGFVFPLFTYKMLGLYYLTKDLPDITNNLFNLKLDIKSTILDKELKFYSDGNLDYSATFNLNTEASVKSGDSLVFDIKEGVVINKNDFKVDVNNPLVSKFQDLTGFNLEDMSANLEAKLPYLPDGKFEVKATLDELTFTFTKSMKLGETTVNGSIGLKVERNEGNKMNTAVSEAVQTAKDLCEQFATTVKQQDPKTLVLLTGAALLFAASAPEAGAVALGVAVLSGPMKHLFAESTGPIY